MIFSLRTEGRDLRVDIHRSSPGKFEISLAGETFEVDARLLQPGVLSLLIDGQAYRCILDGSGASPDREQAILVDNYRLRFRVEDPRSLRGRKNAGASANGPKAVKAPMPGRVVRTLVAVGDEVSAQQGIIMIEAMKMQNELKSPKAGRVARISVEVGDTVQAGDTLAVVE